MERGSLIFRTVVVAVVVTVFALSMHPLVQRDYYEVFMSMARGGAPRDEAKKLVGGAQALQQQNKELYPSQALEKAAEQSGVDLVKIVNAKGDIQNNRDVLSLVRKKASSSIRLGLDLNGGVEFYLELVPDEELLNRFQTFANGKGETRADMEQRMKDEFDRYRDNAIEILRNRLEGQKIFEAEIAPSGDRYVALRAPVVAKDEKLKLLELIHPILPLLFGYKLPNVSTAQD